MNTKWMLLVAAGLAMPIAAQDDFPREGGRTRAQKDALEGKAPPALQVKDWKNTDGKPLTLESLRGKVVVLDFWGTW